MLRSVTSDPGKQDWPTIGIGDRCKTMCEYQRSMPHLAHFSIKAFECTPEKSHPTAWTMSQTHSHTLLPHCNSVTPWPRVAMGDPSAIQLNYRRWRKRQVPPKLAHMCASTPRGLSGRYEDWSAVHRSCSMVDSRGNSGRETWRCIRNMADLALPIPAFCLVSRLLRGANVPDRRPRGGYNTMYPSYDQDASQGLDF